jgi:hypothetical protein
MKLGITRRQAIQVLQAQADADAKAKPAKAK